MLIVTDLIDDVYEVASLMPRIAPSKVKMPDFNKYKASSDDAPKSAPSGEDLENEKIEKALLLQQFNTENETYLGEMKNDKNLSKTKYDIIERVRVILEECLTYKEVYEQYSYLWTVCFLLGSFFFFF